MEGKGAVNQNPEPSHLVLKINEKEVESSEFDRSGFYELENLSPKLT